MKNFMRYLRSKFKGKVNLIFDYHEQNYTVIFSKGKTNVSFVIEQRDLYNPFYVLSRAKTEILKEYFDI